MQQPLSECVMLCSVVMCRASVPDCLINKYSLFCSETAENLNTLASEIIGDYGEDIWNEIQGVLQTVERFSNVTLQLAELGARSCTKHAHLHAKNMYWLIVENLDILTL